MSISMSVLDRLERCPPSGILPRVTEELPETGAAARGIAIHRFVELVANVGREKALEALAESPHAAELEGIDLATLPHVDPETGDAELSFAYLPETGAARALGKGLGRDYGKATREELVGTADWVGLDERKRVVVLDLKTGRAPLRSPRDSLQLLAYATAGAHLFAVDGAVVGWLRGPDQTGEFTLSLEELDEFDLYAARLRIRDVLRAVQASTRESPLHIGTHCRYCPAKLRCPAQAELVRELAMVGETDIRVADLSPERLPQAFLQLERLEDLVKVMRERMEEIARSHPIELPDGRIYAEVESERETLDHVAAAPVLQGWGLSAAIEQEPSLSKASLVRAMRASVAGKPEAARSLAEWERIVLARLREVGATKASRYRSVKAFAPKKKAKP